MAVVTITVIITSDVHCFMIAVVCVLKSTDVASDGLETADICVLIITVVSARQHAERAICYRPSVRLSICPSVRLSHGWISRKRLKLGSCNFHHTVAPSL